MKKEIQIQGIDAVGITGIADTNLKILEDSFTCKILLRGDTIFLDGDEQPVTQAEEVISEMMNTFSRKNSLTEGDVRSLVALISEGNHVKLNDTEQVLLYTKQGKIVPKSEGQRTMVETCQNSDISLVIGPAGTGKTYLAVAQAVAAFKNRHVKRIILSRPAVEAGESLGFLPGDLREKIDPYLTPLYDALRDMFASATLKSHISKRVIEVVPLAYMRGRTLNDAFIILDEAQNCTAMQMKMFLTRLGVNSRTIVTGDITQIDLPKKSDSGMIQVIKILKGVDGIGFVYLTESDVVRHHLVRKIINAYDRNGDVKKQK